MGIDVSAGLRARLDDSVQEARRYVEEGKRLEAADTYRRCAILMKELVRSAASPQVQKMRLDKAHQYLELAKQIEEGGTAGTSGSERLRFAKDKRATVGARNGEAAQGEDERENHASEIAEFIQSAKVTWEEIAGLEETKGEIQAAYAIAMAAAPEGVRINRSKGILLYGPPGTGKTLLASATSRGLQATFFNVKASGLLSKYFGESSKLVTALFREARKRAPAVIFIDEIDSLAPSRSDGAGEPAKRILSTLLAEMDGLATKGSEEFLLTIGATNLPWVMDEAILSRFGKLVYVPLPDLGTRRQVFQIHLENAGYDCVMDLDEAASRTEGYSGRDIEKVCADAIEKMLMETNASLIKGAATRADTLQRETLSVRPIRADEMDSALSRIKPKTSPETIAKYQGWAEGKT